MRTLRTAAIGVAVLVLTFGSSAAAASLQDPAIDPISGSVVVERLPGGTFDVQDRVFQYRHFPKAGSIVANDPRLTGEMNVDLSWDVLADGSAPLPSWGTMTISAIRPYLGGPLAGSSEETGSWSGTVTGIQNDDAAPVALRAFLVGEDAYEGLCATLDIDAMGMITDGTWTMSGVVHPVPEAG